MTGPVDRTRNEPTVLVIDDDLMNRALCQEALEQGGFRVITAENGEEGLAEFERSLPDIVLMDVVMPGLDGISTLKMLRGLPHGDRVPVAMMTGLEDTESIKWAYLAGATDFLTKPMNWVILRERVRFMVRASRTAEELHDSRAQLARAQRIARLGSWDWMVGTDTMTWSDEVGEIIGCPAPDLGSTLDGFLDWVHPDDVVAVREALDGALHHGNACTFDHRVRTRSGETRYVTTRAEIRRDAGGQADRLSGTIQDITERVEVENKIRTLAYYDPLTGLPNTSLFRDRLEQLLATAPSDRRVTVLVVDLDHFKRINDTLGHEIGDQILRTMAGRLSNCVTSIPSVVTSLVCRMGSDCFMVLLDGVSGERGTIQAAELIRNVVRETVCLASHDLHLSCCIGAAVFPDTAEDAQTLIRNADVAMHVAKDRGRDDVELHTSALNERAMQWLTLEGELRRALEDDQLTIHYHPQVDAISGTIVGAEALLRWEHPQRGFLSPAEFIPVAEQSGLIVPIGTWVLGAACRQASLWKQRLGRELRIGVNLSSIQFDQRNVISRIEQILGESRLAPELLELEITESVIMSNAEETVKKLRRLKHMGVCLAIDDFGTGYSSLSYLKRFPLDSLKIDRSFVKDLASNPEDAAINRAIIAMGHSLKLRIIAEGVETQEQADFLTRAGCDEFQGYLYSPPVPSEQFEVLVREQSRPRRDAA